LKEIILDIYNVLLKSYYQYEYVDNRQNKRMKSELDFKKKLILHESRLGQICRVINRL